MKKGNLSYVIGISVIAALLALSSTVILIHNNDVCEVTFYVEGQEYSTKSVVRGSALTIYPDVPEKLGYHGVWDYVPDKIVTDTNVNALYTKYAHVITLSNLYSDYFDTFIYETKEYSNKIQSWNGISRDGLTGEGTLNDSGQINFEIAPKAGYVVDRMWIEGGYNQLKTHDTDIDIPENCYRITKVTSDIAVYYSIKPAVPQLSYPSGFYSSEFDLELACCAGGTIYYTLDGTEPHPGSSPRYNGPIHISDASYNENRYSAYTANVPPDTLMDKCTIIRSIVVTDEGLQSDVRSDSFFIGFDSKVGYDGLGTISIITEPDNLFGDERGIFLWKNRLNKGIEWERPVTVQFFNSEDKLQLSQQCGIRIHGSGSRQYQPFGLSLYARSDYGSKLFASDLFNTGFYCQNLTLFFGGNEYRSKIIDKMMADYAYDFDVSLYHYVPYACFVDGEFHGFCWITEKYDDKYLSYYYGADKDNVILIKNNQLEEGKDEDMYLYQEFLTAFDTDLSSDSNFDNLCKLVDLDSLINFYAIELFIGNWDCRLINNYALWRSIVPTNEEYSNAKWHLMAFDLNATVYSIDDGYYHYFIDDAMPNDPILKALMDNNTFKSKLYHQLNILSNRFKESYIQYLDTYVNDYVLTLEKEYERFYSSNNLQLEYLHNFIGKMKIYIEKRIELIEQSTLTM